MGVLPGRIVRRVFPAPAVPAAQDATGHDATRFEIHHPGEGGGHWHVTFRHFASFSAMFINYSQFLIRY